MKRDNTWNMEDKKKGPHNSSVMQMINHSQELGIMNSFTKCA